MTDRATLLALADRVEAASEGDWNLDADIWHVTNAEKAECYDRKDAPPFSTSLDAALALPRKGFIAALSELAADGLPGCCICTDTTTSPPTEVWGICFTSGPAVERLARATTAAALRALAQEAPGDE